MKKKSVIILVSVVIFIVFLLIILKIMAPVFDKLPMKHMNETADIFSEVKPVVHIDTKDSKGYIERYDLTEDEWNSIKPRLDKFSAESSKSVRGTTMMIEELFTQEEIDSIWGGYVDLYSFPSFITKYYCKTIIGEIHTDQGVSISVYSFIGSYKTFSLFN